MLKIKVLTKWTFLEIFDIDLLWNKKIKLFYVASCKEKLRLETLVQIIFEAWQYINYLHRCNISSIISVSLSEWIINTSSTIFISIFRLWHQFSAVIHFQFSLPTFLLVLRLICLNLRRTWIFRYYKEDLSQNATYCMLFSPYKLSKTEFWSTTKISEYVLFSISM